MAVVFASAARTQEVGTYNSDIRADTGALGMLFHLVISAVGGTPTLDLKMQYYDSATATWEDYKDWEGNVVSFAQKTGTGEDDLVVYPSGSAPAAADHPAATNRRYASPIPTKFRWVATVGNAGGDSATFSLASTPLR